MRYVAVFVCLLSVTACDLFSPANPSPVDAQFSLAPGQTETIAGASTRVSFSGVISDSRCPANALCITGGDAVVRIDVWTSGQSSTHELHTGTMLPVKAHDLTIELVEVTPYPFSFTPIEQSAYRVTFRVKR
jgi:hypothetical protein